jgi:DNA-binding CsgD family transcriptional regulator
MDTVTDQPTQTVPTALRPRQLQVLQLLADGLTLDQVGRTLHLGRNTVKYHVTKLHEVFGAPNTTSTVAAAIRRGVIR